jgi:hypothetical protein
MTTFCRTRYEYGSYTDFWRLVELAGYPTIYVDEIPKDAPGETFIVTPINGEWKQGIETSGRVIWWQLEWGLGDGAPPGTDETWTSDRYHAQEIGARFVPLGSHPSLIQINPAVRWRDPRWDVALLAYMDVYRRAGIIPGLKERSLRVAPNGWGEERDTVLERSRCMLNVHQHDEWPCVPVQRFALAAAAAIPLVSEAMNDPFPYVAGRDFLSASYDDLFPMVTVLLGNGQGRDLAAHLMHTACVDYRFDKNVEKALAGVNA